MHVRLTKKGNYPPKWVIALDETAVWSDKIESTTGAKDIPLESTVNEKVRVSVFLTAKADGTKTKHS